MAARHAHRRRAWMVRRCEMASCCRASRGSAYRFRRTSRHPSVSLKSLRPAQPGRPAAADPHPTEHAEHRGRDPRVVRFPPDLPGDETQAVVCHQERRLCQRAGTPPGLLGRRRGPRVGHGPAAWHACLPLAVHRLRQQAGSRSHPHGTPERQIRRTMSGGHQDRTRTGSRLMWKAGAVSLQQEPTLTGHPDGVEGCSTRQRTKIPHGKRGTRSTDSPRRPHGRNQSSGPATVPARVDGPPAVAPASTEPSPAAGLASAAGRGRMMLVGRPGLKRAPGPQGD